MLDLTCNTTIRDLERRRPSRRQAGRGRKREVPFQKVDEWAVNRPESQQERTPVRASEKGPVLVDGRTVSVRVKQDRPIGSEERLVVIRPLGDTRVDYALTNPGAGVPLSNPVQVQR